MNILKSGSITQEAARRCGQPLAQCVARVWRIDAAYQMLNTGSVDDEISQLAQLAQVAASAPALPVVRAGLARALFFLGRTEEACAVYQTLRSLPATGGRDTRTLDALIYILDMIVAFGDTATAQATYDLFGAHVADFGVTGTGVVFLYGSVHWPLGRLAALLGHTGEALDHYAAAVTINTRIGARPFVALSRLGWADALRGRGASDDHAKALLLAGLAAAEARRLDMPGPSRRADQLIHKLQQAIKAQDPLTWREGRVQDPV